MDEERIPSCEQNRAVEGEAIDFLASLHWDEANEISILQNPFTFFSPWRTNLETKVKKTTKRKIKMATTETCKGEDIQFDIRKSFEHHLTLPKSNLNALKKRNSPTLYKTADVDQCKKLTKIHKETHLIKPPNLEEFHLSKSKKNKLNNYNPLPALSVPLVDCRSDHLVEAIKQRMEEIEKDEKRRTMSEPPVAQRGNNQGGGFHGLSIGQTRFTRVPPPPHSHTHTHTTAVDLLPVISGKKVAISGQRLKTGLCK
ncbi:unnamed protein product [Dimorphilus gyrociliatus]|uniref:Uncharacterized protein n=1 Tax=Dimorphilus gyrociliatus TaxID=2664684 RepID=A0A7I8V3P9_9ANNE|nr:unnamed protein product [Dimorphilus gyrociliatus]